MSRWIKIYDGLLDWGWHDRPEMVSLFVHLLLMANAYDRPFGDIIVRRGQLVTSLNALVQLTGISKQSIRTCLRNLEATGEINTNSTQRYTIITICKYDIYQSKKVEANTNLTHYQHTANTLPTQLKENKNNIDIRDYYSSRTREGREEQEEEYLFYKIFFYKNFRDLKAEVAKFVTTNTAAGWKNSKGLEYTTTEQRCALADLWQQKPKREPRISVGGFLPAWREIQGRCESEGADASSFVDERIKCGTDTTFRRSDELWILCPRESFKWMYQDKEHRDFALDVLTPVREASGKSKVNFYELHN